MPVYPSDPYPYDLPPYIVTTEEMRQIEGRVFRAGMPIAALMEKVGQLLSQRIQELWPQNRYPQLGVLVGPGHNGGDALVVARELMLRGYGVILWHPFRRAKPLTADHLRYAQSLGIPVSPDINDLGHCQGIIDGLFGFGLERPLTGEVLESVSQLNRWQKAVISIDIPSGLDSDRGTVLGGAIKADHTLCLGLRKLGLMQDHALDVIGKLELIDIGLPAKDITAILGDRPPVQCLTPALWQTLPLRRSPSTHKYRQGHSLLVGGSATYGGSILLAALAARETGVGMLSVAVPHHLKPLILGQVPDALVIGCPETKNGAIAQLPGDLDLGRFQGIGCGPGLTTETPAVVDQLLDSSCPLALDADGLNLLAQGDRLSQLVHRKAPTLLTPHGGEFSRLFPSLIQGANRPLAARQAAQETGAMILLKGARTAIANPTGQIWINPESTPALARGGSGDVLTGLLAGLWSQMEPLSATLAATWWHSQAGCLAAQENTVLGVNAWRLTNYLIPALRSHPID
ncbi:NAD(P)H-hydrate dehydratase [Candidatus Synechococcus calcipolaris G9]|uniref:Bifunctional NAD(P)H-hydrate repair enzyme n=1 Tax=Candidatus Synechococcus calcipolaris G9 TaxID=1497997 RepID=A0ABT6F352_9SYNE|nr:NAD(P)H-hydrate dehydratase [Candidatus Synechococcus calcipolaris]MDG2992306.1 NAD(P)H-hydrate dehydratase [Candidatus Synechococcus calcipolaris G9]